MDLLATAVTQTGIWQEFEAGKFVRNPYKWDENKRNLREMIFFK